jgi:CxxC motif-containing protein
MTEVIKQMPANAKKKKKGKPKIIFTGPTKQYICLICPNCCALETDGTQVADARCKKGQDFACQEWVEPLRVITTTIRVETEKGTHIIPVKTAVPVPLAQFSTIMKRIKSLRLREVPSLGSEITLSDDPEPLEIILTGE